MVVGQDSIPLSLFSILDAPGKSLDDAPLRDSPKKQFQPHHSQSVPKPANLVRNADDAPATTMMLRNIPNKYTQAKLLQELDENGFAGTYNFFYLPMDVHNRSNVGYAFINFNFAPDAERFRHEFSLHRFQRFHSRKVGTVCPAHVQGLDENLRHFENRAVTQAKNDQYRPIVFKGSLRIEFEVALAAAKAKLQDVSSQPKLSSHLADEKNFTDEPRRGNLQAAILELLDGTTPTGRYGYPGDQEGAEDERLLTFIGDQLHDAVSWPRRFEAAGPPPGLTAVSPLTNFDKPPPGLAEIGPKLTEIPVPTKLNSIPSQMALANPAYIRLATNEDFLNNCVTPRTNGVLLGKQLGSMMIH
jgi:hypothetical protein